MWPRSSLARTSSTNERMIATACSVSTIPAGTTIPDQPLAPTDVDTGLAGKTAIVTGAAGGIGLACARALAAEGAEVVCADLDEGGAGRAAEEVGGLGMALDVTDPASCEELVAATTSRFGALDVLVTCAGVFHATPLDQITAEEWDRIQAVNLKGTFLCCQAALRAMVPQGSGRIVTIASSAGQTGGLAAGASYAASKAGGRGADEVDRPLRRPARHHRELRQPRASSRRR